MRARYANLLAVGFPQYPLGDGSAKCDVISWLSSAAVSDLLGDHRAEGVGFEPTMGVTP